MGSDRPDSGKRERGGAGRKRKGYFKAHKITVNWTALDEHRLLPKSCRVMQILCKSVTQRWQGALADSLALEPSCQSASVSFREWRSCHLWGSKKGQKWTVLSQLPATCKGRGLGGRGLPKGRCTPSSTSVLCPGLLAQRQPLKAGPLPLSSHCMVEKIEAQTRKGTCSVP